MSNIATSPKTPTSKNENKSAAAVSATFLQALQDLATFFKVDIDGTYVDASQASTGRLSMSGDAAKGSFSIKA